MFERYERGQGCPICGAPDWCWYRRYGNTLYLYCARYKDLRRVNANGVSYCGDVATLANGEKFVYVGETEKEFGKFRDLASHERAVKYQESEKKGFISPSTSKKMVQEVRVPKIEEKKKIEVLDPKKLDRIYRTFLSSLILEKEDLELLMTKDHWTKELLEEAKSRYMIRSLPPKDQVRFDKYANRYFTEFAKCKNPSRKSLCETLSKEYGSLMGVPGFYPVGTGFRFAGEDGYLLPQVNVEGMIYRLRIRVSDGARRDRAEQELKNHMREQRFGEEKKEMTKSEREEFIKRSMKSIGKYHNFSSGWKEGGCEGGSNLSFYGLHLKELYQKGVLERVVVCEGEKKGIVGSILLNYLHVTLPGVGMYRLLKDKLMVSEQSALKGMTTYDFLRSLGVKRIAVANDTDMDKNVNVRNATIGLMRDIVSEGFQVELVKWPEAAGKGLDDALLNGVRPKFLLGK